MRFSWTRSYLTVLAILSLFYTSASAQVIEGASGSCDATYQLGVDPGSGSCTATAIVDETLAADTDSCPQFTSEGGMGVSQASATLTLDATSVVFTASGSATIDVGPFFGCPSRAIVSGSFFVDFDFVDLESYSINLNPTLPADEFRVFAELQRADGTSLGVFEINKLGALDRHTDTLPRSGTLPAGAYSFDITFSAYESCGVNDPGGTASFSLAVTLSFGATGQDIFWINPNDGLYFTAANWDPARVPVHDGVRSDTAIFDLDTGSEIRIDAAAATAGSWSVAAGNYNVTGPAEVFSPSTDEPSLRITGQAELMLSGSTLMSVHTSIGETGDSFSFMDVANSGTIWDNAGRRARGTAADAAMVAELATIIPELRGRIERVLSLEGPEGRAKLETELREQLGRTEVFGKPFTDEEFRQAQQLVSELTTAAREMRRASEATREAADQLKYSKQTVVNNIGRMTYPDARSQRDATDNGERRAARRDRF